MQKDKLTAHLKSDKLPLGARDWQIDDVNNITGWSVDADFYQTSHYTLEGLYKPILLNIPFGSMVNLEKER